MNKHHVAHYVIAALLAALGLGAVFLLRSDIRSQLEQHTAFGFEEGASKP